MPRRTTFRALLILLLAALALTGCVSLPRSGPVTAADPDRFESEPELGLAAPGPVTDARPAEIVQGFLQASAAGLSDDFSVAREFLAGRAQTTWDPMAQVRVYAIDPAVQYSTTEVGAVRVLAPAQHSIDGEGRYTESAPDTVIEADFTLARTDGQWRIIDLEDGLLLSEAYFGSLYAQNPLYFLSQDRQALVPDVRWYPRRNLATSAVRGLLQGPSGWLAPAVSTAIPSGTSMTVTSVVVQDGVAQVDLSDDALSAAPEDRALIIEQIEATLRDVPSVRDVRLTVAGSTFEVPAPDPEVERDPFVATSPVVIADGALAQYTGNRDLRPLPGAAALAELTPRAPALGYGENPLTVLLDGTDRLVTAPTDTDPAVTLLEGTDLVPPSVDRLGWVWTHPAQTNGQLSAVRQNGIESAITVPWLNGGRLQHVRISRDGARAVVLWEVDDAARVDVAAVIRDADGTPLALGEPVRIGDVLTGARDVTWVDEVTVAVLGTSDGDTTPTVHLLPLGGPTTLLPEVAGAVSVAAARSDRTLVVGTEDQELYVRNGAGWRLAVTGVRDPAFPG